MGCAEAHQYSCFELEALQAQEQLVAKRTGENTMRWSEYCKMKMCGDSVPAENYMEGDSSLLAEKEKEEEAKRAQKKAKPTVEPRANPGPGATTTPVTRAG